MALTDNTREAYHDAKDAVLAVRHGEIAPLKMAGADRLDLLNRMSTNAVNPMTPGTWKPTVLTNALGRTIDLVTIFSGTEQSTLLTSPGRQDTVRDWLSGYIFFQDDVAIENGSQGVRWTFVGPDNVERLTDWVVEAEISTDQYTEQKNTLFWQSKTPSLPAIEILATDEVDQELQRLFPSEDKYQTAQQAYDILRVEAGTPVFGKDFNEDTIPLEAGLWHAISFSKGCYIGQEIIARLESRGRLAKHLMGLQLDAPVENGTELFREQSRVGQLTSVVESPDLGWIALAMVKTSGSGDSPTTVMVGPEGPLANLMALPLTVIDPA